MSATPPPPTPPARPRLTIFGRGSYAESLRIGEILRKETVGGALLVTAAVIALIWANSPVSESYFALRDFKVGYAPWHLELSLGAWAADGLLAIFFFLVGLELKREFIAGDLRQISKSIVPVAAAVGGVAVPALIYTIVNIASPETLRGWAIPTATDIAFAVAVLAILGSHLPSALRIFLLTLAVVDDLIAITIIAVFYTSDLQPMPLLLALIPLAIYTYLAHRYRRFFKINASAAWLILLPLGAVTWALVHASGIHATVAGVLLGFAVPVVATARARVRTGTGSDGEPEYDGLAAHFADRWSGVSAGVAVPVFAFFSAGVTIGGLTGLVESFQDSIALGIIVGLVVGKPLGILATTFLITRLPGLRLDPALRWPDLVGMSMLAGIGFTVSLLVGELSFGVGSEADEHVKVGVLAGSVIAAVLGATVLSIRSRGYARSGVLSD